MDSHALLIRSDENAFKFKIFSLIISHFIEKKSIEKKIVRKENARKLFKLQYAMAVRRKCKIPAGSDSKMALLRFLRLQSCVKILPQP